MKPLGNRVLLKVEPPSEKHGPIVIPEKARMRPQEGLVLAIGESVHDIHVGDRVLFGKFSAQEWQEYGTVVREPDVIAILE